MERIGDEVAPGLGDALEPADGLDGDAGEDLHEGVVREHGDRRLRVAHPLGAVHSTKTKMQSEGSTERCDGKSGVCRMRTRERDAAAGKRTGTGDGRGPTTAATLDGAELDDSEQRPSDPVGGPWAVGGHW